MFNFFSQVASFFSGIVSVITGLVSFVINAISALVNVFVQMGKALSWLVVSIAYLPALIATFLLGILAVCIIYFILGR